MCMQDTYESGSDHRMLMHMRVYKPKISHSTKQSTSLRLTFHCLVVRIDQVKFSVLLCQHVEEGWLGALAPQLMLVPHAIRSRSAGLFSVRTLRLLTGVSSMHLRRKGNKRRLVICTVKAVPMETALVTCDK